MSARAKSQLSLWSLAGARRFPSLAVLAATVALLAGCGGVADDPERLSEAVARATYDRDTEVLYDHASPTLRAGHQTAEDRGAGQFGESVEYVLRLEGLPEGEIETEGAQRAPVFLDTEGLSFYDVPAIDPDGEQVTVNVALIEDENGSYNYCAVSSREHGDSLTYSVDVTTPVSALVNQVTVSSYTHIHQDLLYTHTGDNRGFGPEHDLARDNILDYFDDLGLDASLDPFTYNSSTYYNVVGVKEGLTNPDDIYIIGAHYDSVNNPGADDNGSGTAAVMEAARVLSQYDFDSTLVFLAFDR